MLFELEICCFNLASAIIAEQAGATRIELCADPADGGCTTGYGTLKLIKDKVSIPVYPIIRPRGGDFYYTEEEFHSMKEEVLLCRQMGFEGVVIGMLKQDGTVDTERCKRLVDIAYPLGVTFHRAFDRAINPFEALEAVITTGCERILSSGQKPVAEDATELLNAMVRQANDRIIIMAGSGIHASNILSLAEKTGATAFHASARMLRPSTMDFINPHMQEHLNTVLVNSTEVERMKATLQAYFAVSH